MRLCFPTIDNRGLDSRISAHFGRAAYFLTVDTETDNVDAIDGGTSRHTRGDDGHSPVDMIPWDTIDALVITGVGQKAIDRLSASGIKVYRAAGATINESLAAYKSGSLSELLPGDGCKGE